jgi:WD40 repeat protein
VNGLVQLWHLETPSCISVYDIKSACVSLSASPSSHCTAIGTEDGHVLFLDFSNPENPRVVHRLHLHHGPVMHLQFDQSGSFLVTAPNDMAVCLYVLPCQVNTSE